MNATKKMGLCCIAQIKWPILNLDWGEKLHHEPKEKYQSLDSAKKSDLLGKLQTYTIDQYSTAEK